MTTERSPDRRPGEIGWAGAALRAQLIVAYFVVTTVWLPSVALRSELAVSSSAVVADLVGVTVWGTFLVAGLWGLRISQQRGWI